MGDCRQSLLHTDNADNHRFYITYIITENERSLLYIRSSRPVNVIKFLAFCLPYIRFYILPSVLILRILKIFLSGNECSAYILQKSWTKRLACNKNCITFALPFGQPGGAEKQKMFFESEGIGTIRQATARAVEMSKIKVSEDSVLRVMQEAEDSKKLLYSEEFDPGSGLTLAAGLTHASHGRIFGSNIGDTTGARVSNAYVTNRSERDNPEKFGLIPRKARERHLFCAKGAICRTTDMRIISLLAG